MKWKQQRSLLGTPSSGMFSLRGARTISFPRATIMDIAEKIISVLDSQTQMNRAIIHVGTNEISRQHSEKLKLDFAKPFNQLAKPWLPVLISGSTPTCGRGIEYFSRLLSLNTCLSSACHTNDVSFNNKFDVFWERKHLFGADGFHLNRVGNRVLSANLAYGVQHTCITPFFSHHPKPTQTDLAVTN